MEYSHPIVGVHIYDANRDCSYYMKVQFYWEGEDILDADTVWQPPVVCEYDVGEDYIKVSAKKKTKSNGKTYWEAILEGKGKSNESNPFKLNAGATLYYLNVPKVKVEVSLNYTVYQK